MTRTNIGRVDLRPPGLYYDIHPDLPGTQTLRFEDDTGDPISFTTVELALDGHPPVPAVSDEPGVWVLPVAAPGLGTYLGHVVADGAPVIRVSVTGDLSPGRGPDLGDRVLRLVDGGTIELTVVGGSGGGGSSQPPVAGDGVDVVGYTVSVDATVIRDGDVRLTDARQPLPHTHPATDITGLAAVATTGSYGDLSGAPTIPSTPAEVGADPAGTAQGLVDGLADVARSGSYDDLDDRPSIPSTPGDVGADPAGAASSAVSSHVAAVDPHGDRAYTDSAVAGLDADDVGAVPADGLPVRIVDDGATTTVTGAGTPADPLVIASLGGGGGGVSDPGWGHARNGVAETYPPWAFASATQSLTSGRLLIVPIYLTAGVTVGSVTVQSGTTAGADLAHQWFCIADDVGAFSDGTGGEVHAVTVDDGDAPWGSDTSKTLALTTPWTVPESRVYVIGVLVAAGTPPNLRALTTSRINRGLARNSNSIGLSGPPPLPWSVDPGGANVNGVYAYVSEEP